MTCHPRESASRNRGTLLCISRNPKRTKADRTSFPERRGTFTRSIQQPLWRCEPIPLLRSVPDTDQLPREFPARPPPASCPVTSNFLAINIWPRKIHLPPSQPQLLSSPSYLIPHNPAVKPRHGRWRPSALPQTTTLGRADRPLAFEVPRMRDVVGPVSRLTHSTPLTPNVGTDDRLGRPSPFLNWKGRKKIHANAGTPALTTSSPKKLHSHPRPTGRSKSRFLQLYCNDPLGLIVVFVPSALIAGHVPLTALAVEELLFPMY